MTFLTTSGYSFQGHEIIEHIAIIQDKMIFANREGLELPEDFDILPETDVIEKDNEYYLVKELVKDELIRQAKRDGANAIIGLHFEICTVQDTFLVVYGNGSSVRIEPVYNEYYI